MSEPPFEINGWTIYAHPLFLDQIEALVTEVEKAKSKDPTGYKNKRASKLLSAILKVALEDIPADPTRAVYRQGDTLGDDYKHWFRAKFLQQFRLFFRYKETKAAKVIVLAPSKASSDKRNIVPAFIGNIPIHRHLKPDKSCPSQATYLQLS